MQQYNRRNICVNKYIIKVSVYCLFYNVSILDTQIKSFPGEGLQCLILLTITGFFVFFWFFFFFLIVRKNIGL